MSETNVPPPSSATLPPPRSSESLAFEEMWKGLRKPGALIPGRREFRPRRAVPFLRNLVLLEAPIRDGDPMRFRLVGTAFERRIQRNIKGRDHFDQMPEHMHADARASIRLMFTQPCGIWQIVTMHYQRHYAEPMEATVLPLASESGSPPLLLSYVKPLGYTVLPQSTGGQAMWSEDAAFYAFLDVGAGIPDWPAKPQ